jgi:N-acetylmannosamine-6-phosphate 2-epimerase/N-acetylmannosamine kinase
MVRGCGGGRRSEARGMSDDSILAIDIGGTKMLAALVTGARIDDERDVGTPREKSAEGWCDGVAALVADWVGRYKAVAAAVTGQVWDGRWYTLNPAILPIPSGFPLGVALRDRLGKSVTLANDAQAAAWGEHRYGAGEGQDIVFLTISTGIGGGVVSGGRLLGGHHGLAASVGQTSLAVDASVRIEDVAGGGGMAAAARALGHDVDARGVFSASEAGADWAERILSRSAATIARLILDLQKLFDPAFVVVGGSIGLAPGFLGRLRAALADVPEPFHPTIRAAGLGRHSGVIGVADLAQKSFTAKGE